MSALIELFGRVGREIPPVLAHWERQVASWCEDYGTRFPQASLSEINLNLAVFIFDHSFERVVLAYAVSVEQLMARDTSRMRGFPNVNLSIQKLGDRAFPADKGHFLGHASGGILDINLFPQRRDLNRGWSQEGRRFRAMERYVAEHLGVFFYHRAQYDDETWIPQSLEYGILIEEKKWWVETFWNRNKYTCFISASANSDLGRVREVLLKKGIEPLVPFELPSAGLTIAEKIVDTISKADLFIAVLGRGGSPPSGVFFEIGYARALGKRILVLSPPEEKVPSELAGLLLIQAGPDNAEALEFALDQVLAVPESGKRQGPVITKKSKPLGKEAGRLLQDFESLGQDVTEADLEQFIESVLKVSGISVVARPRASDVGIDFAIWMDELEPLTGNPVLIEIRRRLENRAQAEEARGQVLRYLASGNARAALIFYAGGMPSELINKTLALPNVLFYPIPELLEDLERRSLGDIVNDLRNKVVHNR